MDQAEALNVPQETQESAKGYQNIEIECTEAPVPTTVEHDSEPITSLAPPLTLDNEQTAVATDSVPIISLAPSLTINSERPQALDRTDSTISVTSPSIPSQSRDWALKPGLASDPTTPLPESATPLKLRNAVPYFGRSDVNTIDSPYHQTSPPLGPLPQTPKRLSYTSSTSLPHSTSGHVSYSYATAKTDGPVESKDSQEERPPWDYLHARREADLERHARELDRREREFDRRERELERRQREFEQDKARWASEVRSVPLWREAVDMLHAKLKTELVAERKKALARESALEENLMRKVNEILDRDRQMYGVMQMSDKEVSEMMESSVGYLMQSDEDIADRVRFQSLLYLSQERLAMEAGLEPASGSGSLSLAWRLSLGPSVVTEVRYNKALELLRDREDYKLDEATKKVMESKTAMEYVVEFTSHLRKEGSEIGDHTFAPGRISKEAYMESVQRQANQAGVDFEALSLLVDYICPK